jgi:vancomycin resistance protein YoaR
VTALIFLLVDFYKTKDAFPPGSFIGCLPVSGLTRQETIELIQKNPASQIFQPTVSFHIGQETFTFPVEELGVYVVADQTVDQAFSLTHKENYIKELQKRLQKEEILLPLILDLNEDLASDILKELAGQINSAPREAGITLNEFTGAYHITPDSPGRLLNPGKTIASARTALASGKPDLAIVVDYYMRPRITEAVLRAAPPISRLSGYTTYYGKHDSPNRIHNIKLIASWINNTILLSGETFSLMDKIGDFDAGRGFKEAYVIVGNELVPELGGGTCQIGTTLYNAAALADMEILSRRNHSFYFNIYPLGRDATVYPGQADFKFRNDTPCPILIMAYADNKKLFFKFFGTPTGKRVEFSPAAVYLLDEEGSFRPSTLREVIDADRPFRTVVVRTVYDAKGKKIKEEIIRSFYKLYGENSNVPIRRTESR